jgi:hypothetical protein
MKDFIITVATVFALVYIAIMTAVGTMVTVSGTDERTLFRAWTKVHNAPLTFEEFTVLHKEGLLPE